MGRSIIYISDFFSHEIPGGAEICGEVLIHELVSRGYVVRPFKGAFVRVEELEEFPKDLIILGNFSHLLPSTKHYIEKSRRYVLYCHDYPFLTSRNPADYSDYNVPEYNIINANFIRAAQRVFCQSNFQTDIFDINVGGKLLNLGGNLWDDLRLDYLEGLNDRKKKPGLAGIQDSPIWHKGTDDAAKYCEAKSIAFVKIPFIQERDFLRELATCDRFIFFPKTPETFSRVTLEARMMGLDLTLNNRIGCAKEPWFGWYGKERGKELIGFMRRKRKEIVDRFEEEICC